MFAGRMIDKQMIQKQNALCSELNGTERILLTYPWCCGTPGVELRPLFKRRA